MFDPLKRDPKRAGRYDERSSLGLGLYIAREIATAHGGKIEARSDQMETVFAVHLPRRQPAPISRIARSDGVGTQGHEPCWGLM